MNFRSISHNAKTCLNDESLDWKCLVQESSAQYSILRIIILKIWNWKILVELLFLDFNFNNYQARFSREQITVFP